MLDLWVLVLDLYGRYWRCVLVRAIRRQVRVIHARAYMRHHVGVTHGRCAAGVLMRVPGMHLWGQAADSGSACR